MADRDGDTQAGGRAARVERTGLALVHEGELILPAAGSEAAAEIVAQDDRSVVHYHFPVEIEVRASAAEVDPEAIADLALRNLVQALRNG